jgi:hypothetical protein
VIAVSLFDYTGESLKPWLENGYECHLFDYQHPPGITEREDGMFLHGTDLSTMPHGELLALQEKDDVVFASCYPSCQHLAVSGSRWMVGKGLRSLQSSIGLFATCTESVNFLGCAYYIENPMSTISTYWRQADTTFNPCDYSGYAEQPETEDYTKSTHLWHGNGFNMPRRNRRDDMFDMLEMPDQKYIHHQPPGKERANIRSKTPSGWSRAVYLANH